MTFPNRRLRVITSVMALVALVALVTGVVAAWQLVRNPQHAQASSGGFNTPGNLLISDQFNNRVIEVDPNTRQIVWQFGSGNGLLCNPGAGAIIGLNDAERLLGA